MSRDPIDLSIVILSYKTADLVLQCLESIFSASHRTSIEVIVVDNASGDDCGARVQSRFPQVLFLQNGANVGHAEGNNVGIRRSRGRYVMILNPDTIFVNPVFDDLVRSMDQQPDVGIATLQLRNRDGSIQTSAWRFPGVTTPLFRRVGILRRTKAGRQAIGHYEMDDWDRTRDRDVDWVQGSCLTIRRSAIEDVGLLDGRFFLYFADVDWCRRVWETGWRVRYLAGLSLVHLFQRESARAEGWRMWLNPALLIHIRDWLLYLGKYRFRAAPEVRRIVAIPDRPS